MTSHRATTAKVRFQNKDRLIEGKKVQNYEKKIGKAAAERGTQLLVTVFSLKV